MPATTKFPTTDILPAVSICSAYNAYIFGLCRQVGFALPLSTRLVPNLRPPHLPATTKFPTSDISLAPICSAHTTIATSFALPSFSLTLSTRFLIYFRALPTSWIPTAPIYSTCTKFPTTLIACDYQVSDYRYFSSVYLLCLYHNFDELSNCRATRYLYSL